MLESEHVTPGIAKFDQLECAHAVYSQRSLGSMLEALYGTYQPYIESPQ